jgi:hypothetical protein
MLGTVNNSTGTGFNLQLQEVIQPGLFRWLGDIAQRYETYRLNKIRFRYVPAVATSEPGSVVFVFDGDVRDPAPGGLTVALCNRYSVMTPTWQGAELVISDEGTLHPVRRHFTRGPFPTSPYDHKTYDVGQLFVFTDGCNTSVVTKGHIWMEYDLVLYDPQLNNEVGGTTSADSFKTVGTAEFPEGTTVTGKIPIEISLPNAEEIADGAEEGHEVCRLLSDEFIGAVIKMQGTSVTNSDAIILRKGSGVAEDKQKQPHSTTEALVDARLKRLAGARPNTTWVQPNLNSAYFATATLLLINWLIGSRFNEF